MRKYLLLLVVVLLGFIASRVESATDGSLGPTSTGSATISITIPTLVSITDVQNLNLGTFTGSGDLSADDSVCVYTNLPAATYKITASGNGDDSAFTIKSVSDVTIPYEVYWNDQPSPGGTELTSGLASATQSGANTSSQTCDGDGNNANFRVRILEEHLAASPPAVYTGTLSLLVEPA
jgi:hypothetical protein